MKVIADSVRKSERVIIIITVADDTLLVLEKDYHSILSHLRAKLCP
jgi:hypothetical protein